MSKRTLRRLTDGIYGILFLSRMSSYRFRDFYDNINKSWWELVTTAYLDPNGYKRGKGKATSQIELRTQNGQTQQRSYANSALNSTNGEAVSHHYSYDRQAEK